MSYATGEAAILTIIRAHANYDSDNTSRQDWKPLDSGKAAYYAILRPGAGENAQLSPTSFLRQWVTVVEVWQRYIDDTKPASLQARFDELVRQIEQYPTLDGASGVIDASVTGWGDMEEVQRTNGALWARWSFNVQWREEYTVTYAE